MTRAARTLVALSGGVDSATAAGLLVESGRPVVGVFLRNGVTGAAGARSCCSLSDSRDARAVADRLGIPFFVHDGQRSFGRLIDAFARDYVAGLTPNPCVVCNNDIKFGELLGLADDLGCATVATGHYARCDDGTLRRAADRAKDQSYLLHGLREHQLRRACFPVGHLAKGEVRAHARRLGLAVADKPDSADICFVPGGDYRQVVAERLGTTGPAGALVDGAGRTVGRHEGVAAFTVGQRRGLGLALGAPVFVNAIEPETGTVRVGPRGDLATEACVVTGLNWLSAAPEGRTVLVQLRHHHDPEPARLQRRPDGDVSVRFLRPSEAVTPGQYAVFYDGDRVLGGGRIRRRPAAEPSGAACASLPEGAA